MFWFGYSPGLNQGFFQNESFLYHIILCRYTDAHRGSLPVPAPVGRRHECRNIYAVKHSLAYVHPGTGTGAHSLPETPF
jgi:hypothetical protein